MADQYLDQLTENTAPAHDDLLLIKTAGERTKKIELGTLLLPKEDSFGTFTYPSANSRRFLTKMRLNESDVTMLVVGDSTGNSTDEWVYLVAQQLGDKFPTHTVEYYLWDDASDDYAAADTLQTGSSSQTLHVYNASDPGATTDYHLGDIFDTAIRDVQPDLVLISMGHNEGASAASHNETTWRGHYLGLTESIAAACPQAAIVCVLQNPSTADTDQSLRAAVYSEIAAMRGYGIIDVHHAFNKLGDFSAYMTDTVHPNADGHSEIWAPTVMQALFAAEGVEDRPQQQTPIFNSGDNLLTNGTFLAFGGSVPESWTAVGATTTKDTSNFEPPHSWACRIQASGAAASYIRQSISNHEKYRGKWLTLTVRMRVPAGQATTAGRIEIYDGTNPVTPSRGVVEARDGFIYKCVSRRIASDSTSLYVYIYADSAANASADITVDRAALTVGLLPRLGDGEKALVSPTITSPVIGSNNSFALRNGTTAQTLDVYGTYEDSSNYQLFRVITHASNAGTFSIGAFGAGSYAPGRLRIYCKDIMMQTNSVDCWNFTSAGHLYAATNNTVDIGGSSDNQPRSIRAGTSMAAPLVSAGKVRLTNATELTIASGAITATQGYHTIDTEADAASDDLDTISGGTAGDILIITAANDARTVVVKDGTGNVQLAGDMTLDNTQDTLTLIYNGSAWLEVARSNNGA